MTSNRRAADRIPIFGEIHGEVMVFQPTTITEMSLGGAQIETSIPLPLNSLHEFRLTLGGESVMIRGRVAHCKVVDPDAHLVAYRSGIEFVAPSKHVGGVIASFLQALRDSRGISPQP